MTDHRNEFKAFTWRALFLDGYTLLLAVVLPLEQMAYHADYQHPVMLGIRWLAYLWFGADFLARAYRGEYAREGASRPWMLVDVAAMLPLGPVAIALFPHAPAWILVMLHLLPMLRLARVYVSSRAWQQANPSQTAYRRIVSVMIFIGLLVHGIGCWQIAVYDAESPASLPMRYLQALYWTVTTMTTIGYGDITPDIHHAPSLLFTMAIMALGAGIFGFIIGNIATIMTNLDFARIQHLDKMQRINTFLRYHQMPESIRKNVHQYYNYHWQTRRGFDESAILADLPESLRGEVELHLRRDIVTKVPLFKGADPAMIRRLVGALKTRIAAPGEYVIRRGDIGEEMYFIARGRVEVLFAGNETPVATLGEGSFFGEMALLERQPRNADVRTLEYTDLYSLSKTSLDQLAEQYPEFGRHLQETASQRSANWSRRETAT